MITCILDGTSRPQERIVMVAITRQGALLGTRLRAGLAGSHLFVGEKFAALAPGATAFAEPVGQVLGRLLREYDGLVLFISLGAVMRLLAPHLQDKKTDPGVVVVDDRARFAIPVLSGHLGGANELARRVAAVLGSTPVITTASDAAGTLAVDLLGQEFGWVVEDDAHVTAASAAVVNGEPVGVFQDAGERDWWPAVRPLPANVTIHPTLEVLAAARPAAALVITDRLLDPGIFGLAERPVVVYRPRSLAVGVGCHRNVTAEEFAAAVEGTLTAHGLSPLCMRSLATIEARRDEPGLRAYAAGRGLPIAFYPAAALDAVAAPNPSAAPLRHVGTRGVCEPAALLCAGASDLVVEKRRCGNVTVAVARIPFHDGEAKGRDVS